jgi:hypothetical protein
MTWGAAVPLAKRAHYSTCERKGVTITDQYSTVASCRGHQTALGVPFPDPGSQTWARAIESYSNAFRNDPLGWVRGLFPLELMVRPSRGVTSTRVPGCVV